MSKMPYGQMRPQNSVGLAGMKKLSSNRVIQKNGPGNQTQDSIIVIDDTLERTVPLLLILIFIHKDNNVKMKGGNGFTGDVKFMGTNGGFDGGSRQFPDSNYNKMVKKRKLEGNRDAMIVDVENPNVVEAKKSEIEIKNRYANRERVYKTYFSDVDPIDYFITNNPGKAYEDVLKLKLNHKKNQENDELTDEDQESIVNMLKEFYEEKSEQYNLCTCQYCSHLTLPFLVKKDITDQKEIQSIQQKHAEYYSKHFPDANVNQPGGQIKELNNILFKKVSLGEIKCKWTVG